MAHDFSAADPAACIYATLGAASWVGAADDVADAGLIKTLIAVVALQDFQVRADRPVAAKSVGLLLCNGAGG